MRCMTARQIIAAIASIGILIAILLLLLALGLLIPFIIFVGLAIFLLIIGAILIFILLSVVLAPYYFFTKRPKVEPGSYRLEEVEEK